MIVVAAALAVAVAPGLAAAERAATPPAALYKALLKPIADAQLPAGFNSAKTAAVTPGGYPKAHHAVGQVDVNLNGDKKNGIIFWVFPTHADAVGSYADGVKRVKTSGITPLPVSGKLPKPSTVFRMSGLTEATLVVRNVVVLAVASRGTDSAISLARFALEHVNAVK